MAERIHFLIFISVYVIGSVTSLECPNGWNEFNNYCWYYSRAVGGENRLDTWTGSESYCQQYGGHLAIFTTPEERDNAYNKVKIFEDTDWWIGLTDHEHEGTYTWLDGTSVDPSVAKWKPGEPSNTGGEDCVEMWVNLPLYRGQWNDKSCDAKDNFICKRSPGPINECEDGWTKGSESCYKSFSESLAWYEADAVCKGSGSNLVAITSEQEQSFVKGLVSNTYTDYWIGLSDTSNPGTMGWTTHESTSYTKFANGQSVTGVPYTGSSCAVMDHNVNFQWVALKCSDEYKFVCEKGFKATCPVGYTFLANKCYELVVNTNRAATWTTAMEECKAQGASLLKIETPEQQQYLGTALEQYYNSGAQEIWIGGSDIGHDDTFTWWDNTAIGTTYWDANMPRQVADRYDCIAMYSGSGKWETSSCFHERQYICELPEGSKLPDVPPITVDGKCNDGWRWMENFCYFFGKSEKTQQSAKQFCESMSVDDYSSELASIVTVDEMSFIHGHIQQDSWIGLEKVGSDYQWIDGTPKGSFENWGQSAAKTQTCVYMRESSGTWHDASCSEAHTFVCKTKEIKVDPYVPTPPVIDGDYEKCGGNGWFSDPTTDKCYKIDVDRTRSWNDARYNCQLGGGDLLSINSAHENDFISGLTQELAFVANLWIGASDKMSFQDDVLDVVDGGWAWSDGSPFNYVHWNDGEPNNAGGEDCVELYIETGFWNDLDCAGLRHFACEKRGNSDSIIGNDVSQVECKSNEACCFKHLGVEKGGSIPDSALSASSIRNQNYNETRGRLNTQETILITSVGDVRIGYHGGWMPDQADQDQSWYQVDFPEYTEFKGIITQGRNGYELNNERQWVKSYRVSYSQDPDNVKSAVKNWEFISDADGPIIFQGNRDQDTQVTNLFPKPIIARHMRCHPVTYYDRVAMRLEYIGCTASCLHNIGMSSGYILDGWLLSSSGDPKQARPPVDNTECLNDGNDKGSDYSGWIAKTMNGLECQAWSSQSPHPHDETPENNAGLVGNYCRNPNGRDRPWCYTMDPSVEWEYCNIPTCPQYIASGWQPSSSTTNQWIQIQFDDYYKISGITVYSTSNSYVKTYKIQFSDNGVNFYIYKSQNGADHIFNGVDKANSAYTDILREPLTTKYLRLGPQSWSNRIVLQFEVNGCYSDEVITCAEKGTLYDDDSFTITCPGGCVTDLNSGLVYGTDTYTESSAICPAAVHAGKLSNDHGGTVDVTKINGRNSYAGSFRNGINSLSYGTAKQSMIFNGKAYRCPDNWLGWNEHCYYLSPPGVEKSWTEARSDCIALGGDLVSIATPAENDFVMVYIVQSFNGGKVWIGLNALDDQFMYLWSDGSPVTMTKWYLNEPNNRNEKCCNIYRNNGYWNDRSCETKYPYMCKREKEHLPPATTIVPPTDAGCEFGWKAYGYSCYRTSSETRPYYYANQLCSEMGAHLVTISDQQEQAFVHVQVTSSIPPTLGYTSWIGMAAKNDEKGAQIYEWESGEPVTYTLWDQFEPDVDLKCAFPFVYQGQTYYECTTAQNPVVLRGQPWCSLTPVFAGAYIYCGTGNAQGCAYMDDKSGYWKIDLCTSLRYYTCEKTRIGYTEPMLTTVDPRRSCADGWVTNDDTVECYQINEFSELSKRTTWQAAYDHCTSQKADLVSIHSANEELAIAQLIQDKGINSNAPFWTGLNSISNNAGYSWSDGSAVSYTNWAPGEPSDHNGRENCVESLMTEYSQWNDINCDSFRNWICKIGKNRTPNPPPTVPPPQGIEDGGCGEGWIKYTTTYGITKCYKFVDDDFDSWQRSETECQGMGGHLAAIHDQDENTVVLSRAAQGKAGSYWIGLRDIGGRSFYWADESTLDYVNWGPEEPNNYLNNEDCADFSANNGLWNDDNCGLQKAYICEKCEGCQGVEIPPTDAPTGGCPDGFVLYGNKCYYSSMDISYSFNNASQYCQDMSAELAVINNEYEQAFLASYLYGVSENVWIGFYHRNTGSFVWVDQSPVTYVAWDGGQPDNYDNQEGCAEMWLGSQSSGRWNDFQCGQSKSFACYVRRSEKYSGNPPPINDLGCPGGYTQWNRGCYLLVTEKKSFEDAKAYCRKEGNDLINIYLVYENELLHSWFWKGKLSESDQIWTGLTYSSQDDGNITFSWSNMWPVEYTNWGQGQPEATDTSGCVYMNSNGLWYSTAASGQINCDATLPFVCKKNLDPIPTIPTITEGNCDPNYDEYKGFCYYVNRGISEETSRSWFEARAECEAQNAELASFHSDGEVDFLINSLNGDTPRNLYIGLYSNGYDGWMWSDGSAVEYLNWNDNEPNGQGNGEECVEMYSWNGAWNDVSCYEDRGYVCKKAAGLTRCNVLSGQRIECGYEGISETYCITHRGCCYDPTTITANFSGCYWAENEYPSGFPGGETPVSGLSGGQIAGIVIGVLLAVALIGGIIFYVKRSGKNMPSLPSIPSFTSKKPPPQYAGGGFDNPVSTVARSES